jgi:hypothetical protein
MIMRLEDPKYKVRPWLFALSMFALGGLFGHREVPLFGGRGSYTLYVLWMVMVAGRLNDIGVPGALCPLVFALVVIVCMILHAAYGLGPIGLTLVALGLHLPLLLIPSAGHGSKGERKDPDQAIDW